MTTFNNMPKEEKEKLEDYLDENFPESDIKLTDIKIDNDSTNVTFTHGKTKISVPAPDINTTNTIWQILAGGAIALAGVYVGTKLLKKD